MKEIHGKTNGPTLNEIFGINNKVLKTDDPDEYHEIISKMSAIELQEHIADNYDRVPPAINSKEERRRLISICMREFRKRIKKNVKQGEIKQASRKSKDRVSKIFNSFGL